MDRSVGAMCLMVTARTMIATKIPPAAIAASMANLGLDLLDCEYDLAGWSPAGGDNVAGTVIV